MAASSNASVQAKNMDQIGLGVLGQREPEDLMETQDSNKHVL